MEIAKYLVAFVAVYSFGGLIADGIVPATARQHLRNPAWPPHAKFHNGQTMLLGIINGAIALVVLFAFRPLTLPLFLVAAASARPGTTPSSRTRPRVLLASARSSC